MKTLLAILSIAVLLLGFALWKRDSGARAGMETIGKEVYSLSNKLAEAQMKVTHQEQLATVARGAVETRTRDFVALSNTVAAVRTDLAQSRHESTATQARVRELEGKLAAAKIQAAALTTEAQSLAAQLKNTAPVIEEARANYGQAESARFALANKVECLKIEKMELERQLNDSHQLRLQLRRLQSRAQFLELGQDGLVSSISTPQPAAVAPNPSPQR